VHHVAPREEATSQAAARSRRPDRERRKLARQ